MFPLSHIRSSYPKRYGLTCCCSEDSGRISFPLSFDPTTYLNRRLFLIYLRCLPFRRPLERRCLVCRTRPNRRGFRESLQSETPSPTTCTTLSSSALPTAFVALPRPGSSINREQGKIYRSPFRRIRQIRRTKGHIVLVGPRNRIARRFPNNPLQSRLACILCESLAKRTNKLTCGPAIHALLEWQLCATAALPAGRRYTSRWLGLGMRLRA